MIIFMLVVALTIVVLVIPFVISTRTPVKYAVRLEDAYKYPNSVLVKEAWHTGTGWEQVGDTTGYFKDAQREDVHLIGNIPPSVTIGGSQVNTFLCKAKLTGYFEIKGDSTQYKEYEVFDWYPIYPVKRNTILPSWLYPDEYLSKFDIK